MNEHPIDENALARAVELVSAAYGDAMNKAGLLKGMIQQVHMYAAATLVKLDEQEEDPESVPGRP
jgi:hypothetical protein